MRLLPKTSVKWKISRKIYIMKILLRRRRNLNTPITVELERLSEQHPTEAVLAQRVFKEGKGPISTCQPHPHSPGTQGRVSLQKIQIAEFF